MESLYLTGIGLLWPLILGGNDVKYTHYAPHFVRKAAYRIFVVDEDTCLLFTLIIIINLNILPTALGKCILRCSHSTHFSRLTTKTEHTLIYLLSAMYSVPLKAWPTLPFHSPN